MQHFGMPEAKMYLEVYVITWGETFHAFMMHRLVMEATLAIEVLSV